VLVTGATGFIGAHVVHAAAERGARVLALVRPSSDPWRLQDVSGDVEVVECDLLDLDIRDRRFADVSVVHHLAAAGVDPRAGSAESVLEANVQGTWRLVELARANTVQRFVYCGSCFEYGSGSRVREDAPLRPRSVYAASKSAGWLVAEAARTRGLPLVTLRPFTVYGPYEAAHRLVPSCILRALADEPVEITSGEQRRDFVYVEDVAAAFLAAAEAPPAASGGVFNVCTGVETTVAAAAALAAALARAGAVPAYGAVPQRPDEVSALSGDPTRAAAVLGFEARTSLEEGLRRTAAWFRAHRSAYLLQAAAR